MRTSMEENIPRRYGAALETPWVESELSPTAIVGRWPEDLTEYEIEVPHQIRTQLIEIQNRLSKEFQRGQND